MGRKEFSKGSGLLITPCNSIHMIFMKFPLDIVFLDKNNVVIYLIKGIKPWSVTKIVKSAKSVLELPEGTINDKDLRIGDTLDYKY
jgi:hypothetical protein